ncbi:hypothetical protein [Psychrobacter sp. SWN149]|uniref:hypothetical protein n=1 Tax=Psychrobacter sp. SWN149 TaxID=2792057 RepID=UPI0018CF4141|nr:hypothetical protein [Psychrobacter sp. SWN149]MBH0007706.1 hypothetical protein [Psychrobacter sp. SWN149]
MTQSKFKRVNFSLTEQVSKDIDSISFLPKDFKCSRSDVVKAAILSFKNLSEEEKITVLREVCDDRETENTILK